MDFGDVGFGTVDMCAGSQLFGVLLHYHIVENGINVSDVFQELCLFFCFFFLGAKELM